MTEKGVTAQMKRLINTLLNPVGLEVATRNTGNVSQPLPTWKERLRHAKMLGLSPSVILDGGAFKGLWSRDAAEIFPGAQLVLVEPNPFVQKTIRRNLSSIRPSPILLRLALGNSPGSATLNIWKDEESDMGASLLPHVRGDPRTAVHVQTDTLDNIAERVGLRPDLVKLDLQGAELLAIGGGAKVLERAEFVIIEFGCLEAYIGRATPRDIMVAMYDRDYCLYDVVDCDYRPYDGALTGGDFFFVKNSSVLRRYKGWE